MRGSHAYSLADVVKARKVGDSEPDLVVCPEPNPLRDGAVLLGLLGQLLLDPEGLLRRLQQPQSKVSSMTARNVSLVTGQEGPQSRGEPGLCPARPVFTTQHDAACASRIAQSRRAGSLAGGSERGGVPSSCSDSRVRKCCCCDARDCHELAGRLDAAGMAGRRKLPCKPALQHEQRHKTGSGPQADRPLGSAGQAAARRPHALRCSHAQSALPCAESALAGGEGGLQVTHHDGLPPASEARSKRKTQALRSTMAAGHDSPSL